jgi:hypothetical protein
VTGAVLLDVRARRALGISVGALPSAAVVIDDTGHAYLVRDDGGLDRIVQGGRPHGGIAEDPTARRSL